MKVYAFDPATGVRGQVVLGEVTCHFHQNRQRLSVKVPHAPDQAWSVATEAKDRHMRPITAEQFKQPAVCFCIGQLTCGTNTAWHWVVLIDPPKES